MRTSLRISISLWLPAILFAQQAAFFGQNVNTTGAPPAPAFIGSGSNGTTTACTTSTTSCATAYSPAAGNFLAVGLVYTVGNVVTSISDDGTAGGCAYTAATAPVSVNSGNESLILYYCLAAKSGTTTITTNGGGEAVVILEFSGMAASSPVDQSNLTLNVTGATTFISNAVTTVHASDVVAGLHYDVSHNNAGWGNAGGFATVPNVNAFNGNGFAVTYKIIASAQTIAATGTTTGADGMYSVVTSLKGQ
jgi:hypothetical protein